MTAELPPSYPPRSLFRRASSPENSAKALTMPDMRGLALPVIILLAWGIAAHFQWGNPNIIVPVHSILSALVSMAADGTLLTSLGNTVLKMLLGFTIGASAGIVLGLAFGLSTTMRSLGSPSVNALRQVAIFAWVPLLTAWVGNGSTAIVALVSLASFLPVVISVEAGCREVPRSYLEVGDVLELGRLAQIRTIVVPAAFPAFVSGLELAIASAWLSTVGAEYLIASGDGLGVVLAAARVDGRMDAVLAAILVLGIIGFILHRILKIVSRKGEAWLEN
ncbi:ABC transporter permease [Aureimonas fodinaquatilis]|uniref:ABC transporter permease n=1 Tax=Aureimonas fodinaquatilis TaxID=2565783 RepID=A0A5B0DXM9_9HYPH|nr:ABC transporter permease [Aureimonas fodinaquatilis]KAA0971108.1 ABC transporter permease [Aureimonas fodinaquatilis]